MKKGSKEHTELLNTLLEKPDMEWSATVHALTFKGYADDNDHNFSGPIFKHCIEEIETMLKEKGCDFQLGFESPPPNYPLIIMDCNRWNTENLNIYLNNQRNQP